jgi:hypothetical protein
MGSMDSDHSNFVPELADVVPLRTASPVVAIGLVVCLAIVASGTFYALPFSKSVQKLLPMTEHDLDNAVVTIIPADDVAGTRLAISAMKAGEPIRSEIERAVHARTQQMGWIVFTDSMDPDGDVVAVRASGLTQQVTLAKAWTPVAVPVSVGQPIEVTGVKDGQGGGITVALATRSGPVTLRILQPGEKLEVMP